MAVSSGRALRLVRSIFPRSFGFSWLARRRSSSSSSPNRNVLAIGVGAASGALAAYASILYLLDRSVEASGTEAHPPNYPWAMEGVFSSLDHRSIRRGWHVYRTVCATCHSLEFVRFGDLVDVAFTENEMKAIASEYEVDDGPDDQGNYYKRPGKTTDHIPPPFPNDEAARAANNGALPLDLSLIVNARKSGKNYLFSLLTGYFEPPAGVELAEGQVFNAYFPGGAISMPEMVQNGVVEYEDGTVPTRSQIAKDVVEFLTWTANQDWDARKLTCTKGIGICVILLVVLSHMYRQRWAVLKTRNIAFVPKRK